MQEQLIWVILARGLSGGWNRGVGCDCSHLQAQLGKDTLQNSFTGPPDDMVAGFPQSKQSRSTRKNPRVKPQGFFKSLILLETSHHFWCILLEASQYVHPTPSGRRLPKGINQEAGIIVNYNARLPIACAKYSLLDCSVGYCSLL